MAVMLAFALAMTAQQAEVAEPVTTPETASPAVVSAQPIVLTESEKQRLPRCEQAIGRVALSPQTADENDAAVESLFQAIIKYSNCFTLVTDKELIAAQLKELIQGEAFRSLVVRTSRPPPTDANPALPYYILVPALTRRAVPASPVLGALLSTSRPVPRTFAGIDLVDLRHGVSVANAERRIQRLPQALLGTRKVGYGGSIDQVTQSAFVDAYADLVANSRREREPKTDAATAKPAPRSTDGKQ